MKKLFLVPIAIAAVGIFWLVFTEHKLLSSDAHNGISIESALKEKLLSHTSQQCEAEVADKSSVSHAIVFINETGKSRIDISPTTNKQDSGSHILIDGMQVYAWFDDDPNGFIIPFDTFAAMKVDTFSGITAQMSKNCVPWQPVEAVFALPSNISFSPLPFWAFWLF